MRPTIFVEEQISMQQWTIFVLVLNVQYKASEIFMRNCYTFRT